MKEESGTNTVRLHTGESGSTREDSRLTKVVAIQIILFHHLAGYDLYAQWSAGRLSVKCASSRCIRPTASSVLLKLF